MEQLQIAAGMNRVVLGCAIIGLQQFQTSGDYMPKTGHEDYAGRASLYYHTREGVQKNNPKKLCPFDKPGGGGQKKEKRANLYFGKVFFQWACRIILGPPKHVLHLVPSPKAIAKAFNVM